MTMTSVKKRLQEFLILLKKFEYTFIKPLQKKVVRQNVQYFSQFASEELVEDFLNGKKSVQNDPKWRTSGAKTKEEYTQWALNGCGMACLQMILSKKLSEKISIIALALLCEKYGGYVSNIVAKRKKDYKDYFDGLFYEEFLHFIDIEFGLKGKIISPLIPDEIMYHLERNEFVVVSVNPNIRDPRNKAPSFSGHLVLMTGYDLEKGVFYLHNPSGIYSKSQNDTEIAFHDFGYFFRKRGMIVL